MCVLVYIHFSLHYPQPLGQLKILADSEGGRKKGKLKHETKSNIILVKIELCV